MPESPPASAAPPPEPPTATPPEEERADADAQAEALAQTRAGLARLHFLVGSWTGEGVSLGEAVRGRMVATLELSGCFLLTREQSLGPDGAVTHEDLAMYRWEAGEQTLKVRHMQVPGVIQEYHVEARDPAQPGAGVRWNAGPFSPRVVLRPEGADGLVSEVWMAWRSKPDTIMRWSRDAEESP